MELRAVERSWSASEVRPREQRLGSIQWRRTRLSNPGAFRRYSRVIYVNIFFMVLELVGGKLSNSFAVISEGSLLIIDIFTSITRIFGAYSLEKSKCRLTQRSTPTSTLATCGWRRWPWSSRSP
jgi:hypothetical protein